VRDDIEETADLGLEAAGFGLGLGDCFGVCFGRCFLGHLVAQACWGTAANMWTTRRRRKALRHSSGALTYT
jgi:hypothetical protein